MTLYISCIIGIFCQVIYISHRLHPCTFIVFATFMWPLTVTSHKFQNISFKYSNNTYILLWYSYLHIRRSQIVPASYFHELGRTCTRTSSPDDKTGNFGWTQSTNPKDQSVSRHLGDYSTVTGRDHQDTQYRQWKNVDDPRWMCQKAGVRIIIDIIRFIFICELYLRIQWNNALSVSL